MNIFMNIVVRGKIYMVSQDGKKRLDKDFKCYDLGLTRLSFKDNHITICLSFWIVFMSRITVSTLLVFSVN